MSRNALIALVISAAIAGGAAVWLFQNPQTAGPATQKTALEADENQSETLFADSMEDVLEEDVEVAVESDIEEDSEVRYENDPGEDE